MIQTGIIFGFVLGFLLRQSQFNFAHELRPGLTSQQSAGWLNILVIILIASLVLWGLVSVNVVTLPDNPDYSPSAVICGSLIFGCGMQLSAGCMIDCLVDLGALDGNALLTLVTFILTLVFYNRGLFSKSLDALTGNNLVSDIWLQATHYAFPVSLLVLLVITGAGLTWYFKTRSVSRSAYWFLAVAVGIGLLAGLAFLANSLAGGFGSFAVVNPLLTWYGFIKGRGAGISVSWGMYFTASIIVGSLLSSLCQRQFRWRAVSLITLIRALGGGLLMGLGAGLSKGTFTSNGLVYTAMLSVQGWLALIFIVVGFMLTDRLARLINSKLAARL